MSLKITQSEFDAVKIARIAKQPGAVSAYGASRMSADGLKAAFDAAFTLLINKHNALVDGFTATDDGGELTEDSIAAYIATGIASAATLKDVLEDITGGDFAGYLKVGSSNLSAIVATLLTSATAAATYLSKTDAGTVYLKKSDAVADYLKKSDAAADYLSKSGAATTYFTLSAAASLLSAATAAATYLSKADAESTYLTIDNAAALLGTDSPALIYLSSADARSTYATLTALAALSETVSTLQTAVAGKLTKRVVDALPVSGISDTTIYLVPVLTDDVYDGVKEYVYTGDVSAAYDADKWVCLGDTKVDLSDYALKDGSNLGVGSVGADKLADGAVGSAKLGAAAVETDKIKDAAVTGVKLADGAVGVAKLGAAAVETAKIKDAAVTGAKLADGAVGTAKLGAEAVETDKIKDGAVTGGKIANGSVSLAKFASGTVDSAPVADSVKPVSSGGVFAALAALSAGLSTGLSVVTYSATIPDSMDGGWYVGMDDYSYIDLTVTGLLVTDTVIIDAVITDTTPGIADRIAAYAKVYRATVTAANTLRVYVTEVPGVAVGINILCLR